jgi:hypothetical protein
MAKVLGVALHRVRQLHDRGHLLHRTGRRWSTGRARTAAWPPRRMQCRTGCRASGFTRVFRAGVRLRGFIIIQVLLPMGMFSCPCACRPMPLLQVSLVSKIPSSAAIAWSTCARSRNVRRKKPQHRLAGAIDNDVLRHHLRRCALGQLLRIQAPAPASAPPRTSVNAVVPLAQPLQLLLEVTAHLATCFSSWSASWCRSPRWQPRTPAGRRRNVVPCMPGVKARAASSVHSIAPIGSHSQSAWPAW